jgi:Ca-activated chloride channel homolog
LSFAWPVALLGLLALPVLVALGWAGERRRGRDAARFGTPALVAGLLPPPRPVRRHVPFALALAALAALIVGLARPHASLSVPRKQATIVLAIDTSRSMAATDVQPNRLAAALAAARAFLGEVPRSYAVGILTFSTRATLVLKPTTDRDAGRSALDQIRLGSGTALGEAIERSVVSARPGVAAGARPPADAVPATVLLLSDGEQTTGDRTPAAAVATAKRLRVPVNTVAFGTRNAIVEVPLPGGLKERVTVTPDARTLRAVAGSTGGRFYEAASAKGLQQVYRELGSRLGRTRESHEVTSAFAGGGALLLLAASGLSMLWWRRPL